MRLPVLCAFDVIELDGQDMRRRPIEQRKQSLAKLVRGPHPGIGVNEHHVRRRLEAEEDWGH